MERQRIFLTGVGGQGTLTATHLLAFAAMRAGLEVVSGEIHGMAQRGGVVESTVLLGGWKSQRIGPCEADILLGFEPLETLRALSYLKSGGVVLSNSEALPPVSVSMGRETYPEMATLEATVRGRASLVHFLPCRTLGLKAGALQSGNLALLGALCATGRIPLDPEVLRGAVREFLKPKLVDVNLAAVDLGVEAMRAVQ